MKKKMKKILMLLAATTLLLGVSGQAMASLTVGDLIRVVYKSDGTGVEVATDLTLATGWTTGTAVTGTTSYSTNKFLLNQFVGSAWSDLSVAYYANLANGTFWFSGPDGGMDSRASKLATVRGALLNMNNLYSSAMGTGKQGNVNSSMANSYWNLMDKSGVEVGSWGTYVAPGNARANLAALADATKGFVDQYLYYYPAATSNLVGPGVQVAKIRTYADGHTDVMNVPAVPIPAAVYLFGSGLLALIGIRRKKAA